MAVDDPDLVVFFEDRLEELDCEILAAVKETGGR